MPFDKKSPESDSEALLEAELAAPAEAAEGTVSPKGPFWYLKRPESLKIGSTWTLWVSGSSKASENLLCSLLFLLSRVCVRVYVEYIYIYIHILVYNFYIYIHMDIYIYTEVYLCV